MSSREYRCSELDRVFNGTGVVRYAVADATDVDERAAMQFDEWIKAGRHASMEYLARHRTLRVSPGYLLPGVKSVVSCAVPYPSPLHLPRRGCQIAAYALGDDYHEVVREILFAASAEIKELYGGETRVCVDTAPLPERYWAVRSGLGFRGRNGHVIIPGLGSFFFLGEILTTAKLPVTLLDSGNSLKDCEGCGACVRACPTGALAGDGTVDARKCLSCLTIEHKGEFPPGTELYGHLYGCDVCGAVCPHNILAPEVTVHEKLQPRKSVMELTVAEAAEMDQTRFSTLFTHSAVKRTKLAGIRRNAEAILRAKSDV